MDVFGAARTIYFATRDNSTAVAQIRAQFTTLALAIATDPASSQTVTSSTINGQTFTAATGMTNGSRLQLLRYIVAMYDRGASISRATKPLV